MPESIRWLEDEPAGRRWLAALPALVDRCVDAWQLQLEAPFKNSYVSWVAPGRRADGSAVVLKLSFPHRESEHEALALERWGGEGAVRLLDHRASDDALLLERCVPGTSLAELEPDRQVAVFLDLLPRLWKQAAVPPFRSLDAEGAYWAGDLKEKWRQGGARMEESLVDAALDALRRLIGTQGGQVLLHQDLHSLNVLRAEREHWLVIDPKPLAGEREFSLAPILRAFAHAEPKERILTRLGELSGALRLDRERVRLWTIAQTVAWSLESAPDSSPVNLARWLTSES